MTWTREQHAEARARALGFDNCRDMNMIGDVAIEAADHLGDALDEIERLNRTLLDDALAIESALGVPARGLLTDFPLALGLLEAKEKCGGEK